jgi:hypothetical protein
MNSQQNGNRYTKEDGPSAYSDLNPVLEVLYNEITIKGLLSDA